MELLAQRVSDNTARLDNIDATLQKILHILEGGQRGEVLLSNIGRVVVGPTNTDQKKSVQGGNAQTGGASADAYEDDSPFSGLAPSHARFVNTVIGRNRANTSLLAPQKISSREARDEDETNKVAGKRPQVDEGRHASVFVWGREGYTAVSSADRKREERNQNRIIVVEDERVDAKKNDVDSNRGKRHPSATDDREMTTLSVPKGVLESDVREDECTAQTGEISPAAPLRVWGRSGPEAEGVRAGPSVTAARRSLKTTSLYSRSFSSPGYVASSTLSTLSSFGQSIGDFALLRGGGSKGTVKLEVRPDGTQQLSVSKNKKEGRLLSKKNLTELSSNYRSFGRGAGSPNELSDYLNRSKDAEGPAPTISGESEGTSPLSPDTKNGLSAFDVKMPSLDGKLSTLFTRQYWSAVWAWLCTFPTLESKHIIVIGLDIVYVLGTTVITILVLSLVTASVFDRVPMSDADWDLDASMILPFELFFCVWMISRIFVRVRLNHWTVLDTVPAIAANYRKSGWLWFDVAVTIPWGLPYYFGLYSEIAFSLLTVVHLTRWVRCFRLNYSSHPLQPSKLGFRLFVTFCAIVSGVHALAVMFPVMDYRSHTEFTYLDCLYYVVVTMVSVGYGDITPRHEVGKGFAIFIIIMGVACISLFTAALTQYLNRTDDWQYELEGKRKMLRKMLNHYEVPWSVQKEMMLKVPEAHQAQKNAQFLEAMAAFPSSVLDKVKLYVLARSLHIAVPIFQDESMRSLLMEADEGEADENGVDFHGLQGAKKRKRFASGVVKRGGFTEDNFIHALEPVSFWKQMRYRWSSRHTETYIPQTFKAKEFPIALELAARMRAHYLDASDVIFQCGDVGKEMYFIMSGVVEISAVVSATPSDAREPINSSEANEGGDRNPLANDDEGNQKISKCVRAMEFFGETALLDETVRTARAKCVTSCELYSLHQRDVFELSCTYPWLQDRLEEELAMAIKAVRKSALFAMASAALDGSHAGSSGGAENSAQTSCDVNENLQNDSSQVNRQAYVEALRSFNEFANSANSTQFRSSASAFMDLNASRLSAANLNPFARAVLDRARCIDILVDIPLSAFDEIGR